MTIRNPWILIAFLVPVTALAAVSAATEDVLELASDTLGYRDGAVRSTDAAGTTHVLAVTDVTGTAVWGPSTTYDELDLTWCVEATDGSLSSCDYWGNIASTPWQTSSGCIYGICWCEGDCSGWLYTCPTQYYDLTCGPSQGGEVCICTEK